MLHPENFIQASDSLFFNENKNWQCFSAGAEIGQHKNDHPYQFMVRS